MEQMERWNTTLRFEWKKPFGAFQTPYHLMERYGASRGSYVYAHVSFV